jgi:endonuclease G
MKFLYRSILVFGLVAFSTFAFAGNCDQFYPNKKEFVIINTTELCNSFYAIRFDTTKNANMASIELVRPNPNSVERDNKFHHDSRIASSPKPTDYVGTGFDKGHMVPAGDATSDSEMFETFLMTNMTPQKPTLNRNSWRMLETHIRSQVNASKTPTYVITGAIYGDSTKMNNIPVPTGYYKVVYSTPQQFFYAQNIDNAKVTEVTRDTLETSIGFKLP